MSERDDALLPPQLRPSSHLRKAVIPCASTAREPRDTVHFLEGGECQVLDASVSRTVVRDEMENGAPKGGVFELKHQRRLETGEGTD